MPPEHQQDPYSPPPRHRERSGAIVRFAIIAALLGAAAWGYMEYQQQPQTALVDPAAQEQMADTSYDTTSPSAPERVENAPQSATPAESTEPATGQPPA